MSIDFSQIPSPCYVIDEVFLRNNLQLIKKVKEATGIEILVSFKAFSNWGVFPIFKEYGFGASASSLNEARLASEELGVKAHTYSPAYEEKTISDILRYSSHLSFNSLNQLRKYSKIASQNGVSIGLRVNPSFQILPTTFIIPVSPVPGSASLLQSLAMAYPRRFKGSIFIHYSRPIPLR